MFLGAQVPKILAVGKPAESPQAAFCCPCTSAPPAETMTVVSYLLHVGRQSVCFHPGAICLLPHATRDTGITPGSRPRRQALRVVCPLRLRVRARARPSQRSSWHRCSCRQGRLGLGQAPAELVPSHASLVHRWGGWDRGAAAQVAPGGGVGTVVIVAPWKGVSTWLWRSRSLPWPLLSHLQSKGAGVRKEL